MEFIYLAFTRMLGESYLRRLGDGVGEWELLSYVLPANESSALLTTTDLRAWTRPRTVFVASLREEL